MAKLNFNANEVQPLARKLFPEGWYNVQITQSEFKATKDETGSYLQLILTILDGDYAGNTIIERLHLVNKNSLAETIAKSTLSSICHAVGVLIPEDSMELHGKPFQAKISLKEAIIVNGVTTKPASNVIRDYRAIDNKSMKVTSKKTSSDETPPWAQ